MKSKRFILFIISLLFLLTVGNIAFAEEKPPPGPGTVIPKLPKTENDPELFGGQVYPEWGSVCTRYTYSVTYKDKEGRPPEYMQIYFNGKTIEMEKENASDNDYKKGVGYIFKNVPNKIDSNFYYFEASNGQGKARDSIIDSPDNGPVLFESAFDKNEIALIDAETGKKIWSFSAGKEWVGGVALSDDGKYLAALTSSHVYFFDTASEKPLWKYEFPQSSPVGGGPRGNGIAISSDGAKIVTAAGMQIALFSKNSNKPLWKYQAPALAVAISKDGEYAAASSMGEGSGEQLNILLLWQTRSEKPIWEFTRDSNFHDVSLSDNGQYLAASTGCPDRKGYIFSKESNAPLVKSERLTYDSPVSKSKISADGALTAFATEGGPESSVAVLFSKKSSTPLWRFDNQKGNSSRALSMTSDGRFIAVATMRGDIYLLNSNSNTPLKSWSLNTSVGALDLAEDGSFVALGGTDSQVYLLSREGGEKKITVNEFIQAIDIAKNGKYVAVGTGGSVYFFEDYISPNPDKIFPCDKIIEPIPMDQALGGMGQNQQDGAANRGNVSISPKENFLTTAIKNVFVRAGIIGFLASLLLLVVYLLTIRFNLLKKYQEWLITRKKIFLIVSLSLSGLFLILAIGFALISNKKPSKEGSNVCGNSLCEPNLGESKETCPKDCAPSE